MIATRPELGTYYAMILDAKHVRKIDVLGSSQRTILFKNSDDWLAPEERMLREDVQLVEKVV